MATSSVSSDSSRLSFAKVAASGGKENLSVTNFQAAVVTMPRREPKQEYPTTNTGAAMADTRFPVIVASSTMHPATQDLRVTSIPLQDHTSKAEMNVGGVVATNESKLVEAIKALDINSPMPSLVVNGSGSVETRRKTYATDGFSEDLSQRADSGSDVGTKPPSLDGKSITSGTTFALDEKESLRPDDSASVKAAEDDDTFSGRGSIVAGSRIGSEAAARAYRAQFYEPPEKRQIPSMIEKHSQGINTPQSSSSGQQIADDKPKAIEGEGPTTFNLFYRQTPDEKLLEALESPKDRMFLLRLEQDVIEFVKDSKEPFVDLPPCNSFCRMLTHKLADYYHMTHQVDSVAGAVRIFRTPFCRLPPTLTSISNPPTTGNTPPPTIPTMKIMRRGGDTGPSPSKATSETGSDGKDKNLSAKDKLSREEREAAYNKARERIFGKDEKTGDATPDTEEGNEMSRSSSVSAKDRTVQSKRSKPIKRRDDDSFDVRSQYTPVFPQPQIQVPTWAPNLQYAAMGDQQHFPGHIQNNFQTQLPSQYIQTAQQFPPAMINSGNMQVYPNVPQQQFPLQNHPRFQPHGGPVPPYGPPMAAPAMPPQWQPQQPPMYQPPYQPSAPVPRGAPSTIPYAFGQLPSTANLADPKSQHPIPGSFNRHAFNPKTQSFVPGNTGLPVPQPMSHHGSPLHGSPHHGSPRLAYNAFPTPQPQYGNGMGYNMARQGSNNSVPSYHASPHMPNRPMSHQVLPHSLPQGVPPIIGHGIGMQQNGQAGTHLPNYGNPSTLPPKPPTGV